MSVLNKKCARGALALGICVTVATVVAVSPANAAAPDENADLAQRPVLLSEGNGDGTPSPQQSPASQPTSLAAGNSDGAPSPQQLPAPQSNTSMPSVTAKEIDALAPRGFAIFIPAPGTDSIIGDAGGFRSALASHGIGITAMSLQNYAWNTLSAPRSGPQYYSGQRLTASALQQIWVTYDASRIGLHGGQFVFGVTNDVASWNPMGPRTKAALGRLQYFQSLDNDRWEIKVGFAPNDIEYMGAMVGGSLTGGTQGANAIIPYVAGISYAPVAKPGISVKFNADEHFYNKLGLMRSVNPDGEAADMAANPRGWKWSMPNAGWLVVDEFGYKRVPSKGTPYLWLRAGALYNNSHYTQFLSPYRSGNNRAFFALGDYQVMQRALPFQGIYVGATVNYAPPGQNVYTRYFEARLYGIGLFDSRPFDMTSLVIGYTGVSKDARTAYGELGAWMAPNMVSYTVSHMAKLYKGAYASFGLGYTRNPTVTPKMKGSLNVMLGLNLFF